MNLPTIESLDLSGKRVVVRGDLDANAGSKRLAVLVKTISTIFDKGARQVVIMGHRGRPDGTNNQEFSMRVLVDYFSVNLNQEVEFVEDVNNYYDSDKKVRLLENLRFWPGEEENSDEFARALATWGDVYVNEAFGNSHRAHASMVGLPKILPSAAGLQVVAEAEHLSRVLDNPARPLVFMISGVKEDKAKYIDKFKDMADKVLVGGRLPMYLGDEYSDPKVQLARLTPDREDITIHYMEHFEGEIKRAGTVVVSGPVGKFEDEGHRQGTARVFRAIAESDCYTVAGGGDTEVALEMLGLKEKIEWISTGGGAMLEFLASKTLPAIEALVHLN